MQKDGAGQIGVTRCTVKNWELNQTQPATRYLPAIFEFLGYEPERPGGSFPEALRSARRAAGLSQEQLAKGAGLDESTIAKWERGDKRPLGSTA